MPGEYTPILLPRTSIWPLLHRKKNSPCALAPITKLDVRKLAPVSTLSRVVFRSKPKQSIAIKASPETVATH